MPPPCVPTNTATRRKPHLLRDGRQRQHSHSSILASVGPGLSRPAPRIWGSAPQCPDQQQHPDGPYLQGRTPSAQDNNPGWAFAPSLATILPMSRKRTERSARCNIASRRCSIASRRALLLGLLKAVNPDRIFGRSTRIVSCTAVIRMGSSSRRACTSPAISKATRRRLTLASLRVPGLSGRR